MEAVSFPGPLTEATLVHHCDSFVEDILGVESTVGLLGLSLGGECPYDLFVVEVRWYTNLEEKLASSRVETG